MEPFCTELTLPRTSSPRAIVCKITPRADPPDDSAVLGSVIIPAHGVIAHDVPLTSLAIA